MDDNLEKIFQYLRVHLLDEVQCSDCGVVYDEAEKIYKIGIRIYGFEKSDLLLAKKSRSDMLNVELHCGFCKHKGDYAYTPNPLYYNAAPTNACNPYTSSGHAAP